MYKLTNTGFVVKQDIGLWIPEDPNNSDYVAYQIWLDEGNTPDPADAVATQIPSEVTMRQARLALLQSGLLAQVDAAVASMPGEDARIEWEFSTKVERNRPLVQSLTAALGLTEAQLDDLFALAATL